MPPRRLTLKQIPASERPRERLIQEGADSLTDAELMAIVLGSGTPSESALQLAQRILKECAGLDALAKMSVSELRNFHGIGDAKAAQLKASLELARRYSTNSNRDSERFNSSQIVFRHFRGELGSKPQEEFWAISLNVKNKLIAKHFVSRGTLTSSLVHPREVFQKAIRDSAAGMIVVHNHPSGDPDPSPEDRKITLILAEAGKLLGIPLLDHVIITKGNYFSFKESGLL
ncbi:DNA repair protein RadC [bacterium]|nr:DNA repair protein RadC [bacterium]MCI0613356.1 DNA repair protein RadC [bacterium]